MTHAAWALQSYDLSGEGINLWITYILFWPRNDIEGLPGWGISSMPGPPPRQHKHERRYTVIPTRRIWNGDYGGQMIFGDLRGHKVSRHLSYGWGKTPKNLTQETCSDRGSNTGPLRDRRAHYRLFHRCGLKCTLQAKITYFLNCHIFKEIHVPCVI